MAKIEARKEDMKYAAVIVGGSLLISLITVVIGSLISLNDSPVLVAIGTVVNILGWVWVAGSLGVALMIRARMRQLYGTPVKAR